MNAERIFNLSQNTAACYVPVDTGNLKQNNKYVVYEDSVYYVNEVDYAKYVELGTMFMVSNPFMRRGLAMAQREITGILVQYLKV